MKVSDLKELAARIGLDSTQKKDDLAENVVAHEAKLRADALARAEKMRAVVVQKKEELEGLSISDLAKLCASKNIEGARSKEERVARLLKQWQDCNGVARALEEESKQERAKELGAMDSASLRKLCAKAGVDPFVKEVLVDRLMHREAAGMISAPKEEEAPETDLVEVLLLREKALKEQKEKKEKEAEAREEKLKALKGSTVQELKKELERQGLQATGSKEAMVQAVLEAQKQKE